MEREEESEEAEEEAEAEASTELSYKNVPLLCTDHACQRCTYTIQCTAL